MKKKQTIEELLSDPKMSDRLKERLYSKKGLLGKDSPFSEILQQMVNTMLEGEIEGFLEEERASGSENKRNGRTRKRVVSDAGFLDIATPRDRQGDFDPELIGKRERSLSSGLDGQILSLYAQGNSVEDVRRLLEDIYGVSISAGRISQITDKVLPEIQEWRTRSLQSFYPIVYLDAIHFKVRQEGRYTNSAFYTVYSVDWEGNRDVLGLYINSGGEGAKKWGMVMEDLKSRGVTDILVVCTDDLQGFSDQIQEAFPGSIVQKCIVHQVRNSLKYVDETDRKAVTKDLRQVYASVTEEGARTALSAFEATWGKKYRYIVKQWEENWTELMAFLDFPLSMRKMIYTTNPVEALHRIMRKLIKSKAAWASETALLKQLYLSISRNEKSWKRKAYGWTSIQREIMELYPDRAPQKN
ncbi:Mobile element protein [Lunatimonas lonarensis]|uniref:Mutator family transposase n=1 Tax=Lunatimonas lonarensis TaxID=1232681 RepID=R7ZL71_9BACT|nr:IS256 family transposase [Lunatimonas lonarensis]EON74838.1 Mobile element protein [Lunatimonas lonarensis]